MCSKCFENLEGVAGAAEDERKDGLAVLYSLAHERLQVGLVGDLESHFTAWTSHLEVHVLAALVGRLGHLKGDAAEGELEADLQQQ